MAQFKFGKGVRKAKKAGRNLGPKAKKRRRAVENPVRTRSDPESMKRKGTTSGRKKRRKR